MFSLGRSSDSEWRLRSRPLYAGRLLVHLSWSQPEPTETGGLTWSTTWMFDYREERGHDEWQHLRGSVIRDADGTERGDARERFARAIATRAGWAPPCLSRQGAIDPGPAIHRGRLRRCDAHVR